MSEDESKPTEEDLINKMLELVEENAKLKAILRASGVMHNPDLEPVRVA